MVDEIDAQAQPVWYRRRLPRIVALLILIIIAVGFFAGRGNSNAERQFLSRFQRSFENGMWKLHGEPTIIGSRTIPVPLPDFLPWKVTRISEYVVTSQFDDENGRRKWGRWFYTCNASQNDGIYIFAHVTADSQSELPDVPDPRYPYIQWAESMVDGIPLTAGPEATNLTVSSPIAVTESLIVKCQAPFGTECQVEIFPPNAVKERSIAVKTLDDGHVRWTIPLSELARDSRIAIHVHCRQQRGSVLLENTIQSNATILP